MLSYQRASLPSGLAGCRVLVRAPIISSFVVRGWHELFGFLDLRYKVRAIGFASHHVFRCHLGVVRFGNRVFVEPELLFAPTLQHHVILRVYLLVKRRGVGKWRWLGSHKARREAVIALRRAREAIASNRRVS